MDELEVKAEVRSVVTGRHTEGGQRRGYANCGRSEGSKRTQFKAGNNANPHGRKGKPPPVLSDEVQEELEAMRHVVSNAASSDWTYQQAAYRRWLNEDVAAFFKRLTSLQIKKARRWS